MSRELTNVKVSKISLVGKPANGEEVTIFKSAENPEAIQEPLKEEVKTEPEVQVIKQVEDPSGIAKFMSVMKSFFGGQETEVAKAADINTKTDYTSFLSRMNNPKNKVTDALWVLDSTLWEIFWDDSVDNGKELILKNIDDFKTYVASVLDQPVEIQKAAFTKVEVKKEEEQDMELKDMEALLAPIVKSIEGITEKVTALETSKEEEVKKSAEVEGVVTATAEKTEVVATEVAKAAENDAQITALLTDIKKSVDGLGERVGAIENFKGLSNGQESTKVEKAAVDEWAGILEG